MGDATPIVSRKQGGPPTSTAIGVPFGVWRMSALLATGIVVIAIYGIIACTAESELGNRTAAEAYYNRLADGLLKGRLSLDLAPPLGLLDLPDPYDRKANLEYRGSLYGVGRIHDLSFYKGRLYLYFSVIPAVVLFVPFHWVTGVYISHQQACFAFSSIAFIAAAALLNTIRKRCFPTTSLVSTLVCTASSGLVPLVPIVLQRPDVWEVPVTAAYCFWMLSLLCLWLYLNRPADSWGLLLLLSTAVGVAIGCRPDGFLGATLLGWPLYRVVREYWPADKSRVLWAAVAVILPITAIGVSLGLYNYGRFGDPFEFGQKYQLNEDIAAYTGHFRGRFFWYNIRLYFLEYPGWDATFPFVRFLAIPPPPEAYGGVYGPVGVLTLLPFTLAAFAIPLGFRRGAQAHGRHLKAIVGAMATLFLSCAIPLTFFFGAVDRYQLEFVPELVLLASIGVFLLETLFARRSGLMIVTRGIAYTLAAASIAFNLLMSDALRAKALTDHGNIEMVLQHWAKAGIYYRRALRLNPRQIAIMTNLGRSYMAERRLAEARAIFERASLDYPESAEAHLNCSRVLFQMKFYDEAAAQCQWALKLSPGMESAIHGMKAINAARRRAP